MSSRSLLKQRRVQQSNTTTIPFFDRSNIQESEVQLQNSWITTYCNSLLNHINLSVFIVALYVERSLQLCFRPDVPTHRRATYDVPIPMIVCLEAPADVHSCDQIFDRKCIRKTVSNLRPSYQIL